jgi:Flp pilus assembly protein TadD
MPPYDRLPAELALAPPNRWDATFLALATAALALGAAAFGGAEPAGELAVIVLASLLGLLTALRMIFDRSAAPLRCWALLPLGLWIALAVWQLAPLGEKTAAALSPTVAARQRLLLDGESLGSTVTLSAYPQGTAHALRLALVAASVFLAVVQGARSPLMVRRILTAALAVGMGEAVLALSQIFTGSEKIYWHFDLGRSSATHRSGSFVNYSNFCQFMNLSLGCGVGLLLATMPLDRSSHRGRSLGGRAASLDRIGWMLTAVVLIALAVFASLSRNGALSLVAAATLVGIALYVDGTLSKRGWILATAPMAVALGTLCFAYEPLAQRFSVLRQGDAVEDRWELAKSVLAAWRSSPTWGWGLGAFEQTFPQFDRTAAAALAQHADNDYLQLLEETGLVGAAIAAAFLACLLAAVWQVVRRGKTQLSLAAFGLLIGLIAVAIHSATDFGLRLPATSCLFAVTCGALTAIARWEFRVREADEAASRPLHLAWLSGAAATLAALAAGAWSIRGAADAHRADQWRAARTAIDQRIANAETPEVQDYIDLVAAAEDASAAAPQDVENRYLLNLDRWRTVEASLADESGVVTLDEESAQVVRQIADELAAARRLCPTYGPPYALEGQIRRFVLGDARGDELVRRGVALAPGDAATAFIAAEFAVRAGDADEARRLLAQAVALSPGDFAAAARMLLFDLDKPEWALTLAGDRPNFLTALAAVARTGSASEEFVARCNRLLKESLERRAASDRAQAAELAQLAQLEINEGRHRRAVELLQRALALEYKRVDWRLQLAVCLQQLGDLNAAEVEARRCLRFRPGHAGAIEFLKQLPSRDRSQSKESAARPEGVE